MPTKWERLVAAGKFTEAGEAVGREIQERRRNRRCDVGVARRERPEPASAKEFIESGGMRRLERRAAFHAAQEAVRDEREYWLWQLERWLQTVDRRADFVRLTLEAEIKRLRRALGIPQSDEERRAKTRERVRRHRRQGGVMTPAARRSQRSRSAPG
jgi:hypothetical protein